MGRPRKYTLKALERAVTRYFDSITRTVEVTEKVDSGKRDSYGHVIWDTVPVKNNLGEVATRVEFITPPTIGGLCQHLGISSSTWSRWREEGEFRQIMELVYDRLITWRQEQVVIRKDVKGLIWDLEVNHGCGKKDQNADKELTVTIEGGDPAWRL